MRLTSLDIKRQEFEKEFRGYNAEAVDSFLNTVASQWEEMQEERRKLESDLREMRGRLEHYQKVEEALQEALQTARVNAKKTQENADQKAKNIVTEAELRAQQITKEAEQERYNLKRELARLTNRRGEVAARMRAFLMSEMEVLASYEGDEPVGFIKLLPSEERERTRGRLPATAPLESPLEPDDYDDVDIEAAPEREPEPMAAQPQAAPPPTAPPPAASPPMMDTEDVEEGLQSIEPMDLPGAFETEPAPTLNQRFSGGPAESPQESPFAAEPLGHASDAPDDDPFAHFPAIGGDDDIQFEQSAPPAETPPVPFGKHGARPQKYSWSPDDELGGRRSTTPVASKEEGWLGDVDVDLSDEDFSQGGAEVTSGAGWTNTPIVAAEEDVPQRAPKPSDSRNPAGSREEIDRIRRILDDLD